jgi:hypothetical protein
MNDKNHNSFIHDLQIATPCKANWDEMTGDEQKRMCGMCNMNVFNLSSMTLEEAEALVTQAEGRTCIRMYRRADGTVITKDCPVGIAARVKLGMKKTFAIASATAAVVIAYVMSMPFGGGTSLWNRLSAIWNPTATAAGCTSGGGRAMMGEMVAPSHVEMGKMVAPARKAAVPIMPASASPEQRLTPAVAIPAGAAPQGRIEFMNPQDVAPDPTQVPRGYITIDNKK